MKFLLLILSFCFALSVNAQTDFRKGKIISYNGDTIVGALNYSGDLKNSKRIRFINSDIDTLYKPFEIESYLFDNGKFYTSKIAITKKDTSKVFAEYLVNGEKDMFFYRSKSGFHYAMSISDDEILKIPYEVEIVNIDGVSGQKESKQFVGYLKYYFKDCPSLYPEIERLKSLNRESLISLTKKYNEIICGENACVIYEKKRYPFKMSVEPVYSYYLKNDLIEKGIQDAIGVGLHFWIPNSSERLYVKTGCLYSQYPEYIHYQFPLQFEYRFPFRTVVPKVDIGVNWHVISSGGIALTTLVNGGCLVQLSDLIDLEFEIGSDLFSLSYETNLFITCMVQTGIHIKIPYNK